MTDRLIRAITMDPIGYTWGPKKKNFLRIYDKLLKTIYSKIINKENNQESTFLCNITFNEKSGQPKSLLPIPKPSLRENFRKSPASTAARRGRNYEWGLKNISSDETT